MLKKTIYTKYCTLPIYDIKKSIELNPEYVRARNNLAKVQIILEEYENALQTINAALHLFESVGDRVSAYYLECVARKVLDMDTTDCENQLKKTINPDVEVNWSFQDVMIWLGRLKISKEKFVYGKEMAELFKSNCL